MHARTILMLATLTACARAQTSPSHVQLPEPAPSSAKVEPRSALAFSSWDGVYLSKEHENTFMWIRTRTSGVSMWAGANLTAATTTRTKEGGWRFELTEGNERGTLTLTPGDPWRAVLEPTDAVFTQRIEPLEARVRARLTVGTRFTRVDSDRRLTHDTITILPHAITRAEMPDSPRSSACFVDVLGPALDDHGAPYAMPLPKEGSLGVVHTTLYRIGRGCPEQQEDPEVSGQDGSLLLVADREGRVVGAMLAAYMYAALFIASDVTHHDLDAMVRAVEEQLGSQAE